MKKENGIKVVNIFNLISFFLTLGSMSVLIVIAKYVRNNLGFHVDVEAPPLYKFLCDFGELIIDILLNGKVVLFLLVFYPVSFVAFLLLLKKYKFSYYRRNINLIISIFLAINCFLSFVILLGLFPDLCGIYMYR